MNKIEEVKPTFLDTQRELPLLIQAEKGQATLLSWAGANRDDILSQLQRYGGIVLRGFDVKGVEGFEEFIKAVSSEMMGYQDRATPRHQVKGNILTATEYPPDHEIHLHNENAFAYQWPSKIFFYCVNAPDKGGETPIADVRKVFDRIAPDIQNRFRQTQVMYMRNFGGPFGLKWQNVFQTEDKETMEQYCREAGIQVEWKEKGGLRTRQVRPAVLEHPLTGETVWFNHAAVLHVSTVEPNRRRALLKMFKEEDLPNNTYYGDGSRIEPEVLDVVREAYQNEKVVFKWQEGDVMMLDNMLVAHGRNPFEGKRQIVVGMADPLTRSESL